MAAHAEKFDPYHKWLGIAPDEQPPSHYRLLGLRDFEEDADAISHAADRAMAHIRTFHQGPRAAWSQRILNELAAARVCLLDSRRKEAYDQSLRVKRGIQRLPHSPHPPPTSGTPASPLQSVNPLAPPRSVSDAVPVRAIVARRRAKRRMRELVSFVLLVCVLAGLVITAVVLFRP